MLEVREFVSVLMLRAVQAPDGNGGRLRSREMAKSITVHSVVHTVSADTQRAPLGVTSISGVDVPTRADVSSVPT